MYSMHMDGHWSMKKKHLIIVLIAAVALASFLAWLFFRRAPLEKTDVQLRLSLHPGDAVRVRRTDNIDLKVEGSGKKIKYTTCLEYTIRCLEREPNGVMVLEQTWDSAWVKGSSISYHIDWKSGPHSPKPPLEARLYNSLLGNTIKARVSPHGRLLALWNGEVIADALMSEFDPKIRDILAQAEYMNQRNVFLKKIYDKQQYILEPILRTYPKEMLSPGQSCQSIEKSYIKWNVIPSMQLTYRGMRKGKAMFDLYITFIRQFDPRMLPPGVNPPKELLHHGQGNIEIDTATGVITKMRTTRDFHIWEKLGLMGSYVLSTLRDVKGTVTIQLESEITLPK